MTDPCRRACAAVIPNSWAKSQGKQPRHPIPLRRTYRGTDAPSVFAAREQLAADPLLSHEHIQSVTILPDHGVLAGVPDGSTSKQGMRQDSDSPIQRASVER